MSSTFPSRNALGLTLHLFSLLTVVVSVKAFAKTNMKADRCLLTSYPDGPLEPTHFAFESSVVDSNAIEDGQVLVKLLHISVDPYMRTRFAPGPGYIMPGFEIGKPIESSCVAEVVESKNPDYEVGSLVTGMMPWETLQVVPEPKALTKLPQVEGMPSSYFLGVLGLTGLSAYLPFKHFSKEFLNEKKDGPVVFVSGSAGAVGSVFGQLCKTQIKDSTVFGSAGTQDKIDLCRGPLGFDDTKTESRQV